MNPLRRFVQIFGINFEITAVPPQLLAWLQGRQQELSALADRYVVPALAGLGVGLSASLLFSAGSFACLGKYYIVSFSYC